MTHPYHEYRQGKMERERVGKILHDDKHADKGMIRDAVHRHESRLHPGEKETKLKHGGVALGKKARHRLDKPGRKRRADGGGVDDPISPDDLSDDKRRQMDDALNSLGQVKRAKGGRVKGNGGVHVNVMVAPKSGPQMPGMGLPPGPMPAPGPVGALGGAPPGPGLPPGGPPPIMRKRGGRVHRDDGGIVRSVGKDKLANEMGAKPPWRAVMSQKTPEQVRNTMRNQMNEASDISDTVDRKKGGRVGRGIGRMTPVKAEGMRNGTQVQNSAAPDDQKDMRTFPPVTYNTGGRVKAHKYPKMEYGAVSGLGRIEKAEAYGPKRGRG